MERKQSSNYITNINTCQQKEEKMFIFSELSTRRIITPCQLSLVNLIRSQIQKMHSLIKTTSILGQAALAKTLALYGTPLKSLRRI